MQLISGGGVFLIGLSVLASTVKNGAKNGRSAFFYILNLYALVGGLLCLALGAYLIGNALGI